MAYFVVKASRHAICKKKIYKGKFSGFKKAFKKYRIKLNDFGKVKMFLMEKNAKWLIEAWIQEEE